MTTERDKAFSALLSAARSALTILSRPAVYPADIEAVRSGLREAINKATQPQEG